MEKVTKGKKPAKHEAEREKKGKRKGRTLSGITGVVRNRSGMEMVQVAILIALAVALGIIFRTEITEFVNNTFRTLNG